jgi:DNA-binding SARP family transcriptional activator
MHMDRLDVQLFGRFAIRRNGNLLPNIDALKVQELFSYLILNRSHPHSRETLAGVLWGDGRTEQARKYLRQTLWQLQSSLADGFASDGHDVLTIDPSWVHINIEAAMDVDVLTLERAFDLVRDVSGADLSAGTAQTVKDAVALYRGDLLEGWYQDWCLLERERLQVIYLTLLDKLMSYCEQQQEYESGIAYGHRILLSDRAREHTHRRMMRLHALSGDRTSALRQYERCVAILADELDVGPSRRTVELYEQIRADRFPETDAPQSSSRGSPSFLSEVSAHLRHLRTALTDIDHQLARDIEAVERASLAQHTGTGAGIETDQQT